MIPGKVPEGRVLVQKDHAMETTAGGIVIPTTAAQRPSTGVVVDVGPGEYLESGARKDPPCMVGARVMFSKFAGTEYEADDGQHYQILAYTEILLVLA